MSSFVYYKNILFMYIYQTMSNNFGYIDIILLAMIAGFIILRLRNILGRKTGHEDKAFSGFSERKFEQFKKENIKEEKFEETGLEGEQKEKFLKGAEIAHTRVLLLHLQKAIKKI